MSHGNIGAALASAAYDAGIAPDTDGPMAGSSGLAVKVTSPGAVGEQAPLAQIGIAQQSGRRIGVFYDGIFWQRLHDYFRYHHPEPGIIDMEGVHDVFRWTAREIFGCPVDQISIPWANFIWTDGKPRPGLTSTLKRLGIKLYQLPFNTTTQKSVGFELELALTCWEAAYDDPWLDLVVLITGSDDYGPLIERLMQDGIKVLVPRIDVDYTSGGGRKRYVATSSHLTDSVTHSPAWGDLLNPGSDYQLVPPLYHEATGGNRKWVRS